MTMNVSPCQTLRNMYMLPFVFMCTRLTLFSSRFLNCLCTERNPGTGAVNTKASNGATREAPKTNGGMTLLMVEGTSAATPTLPTHMELMLR
ncbi:hypothetical protein F2Q69_00015709 [Brassica cretica]|uniref:Uncharacterized protein n=1 Tax=Brassica cretica TaxID=69181 RepID=A0A8S9R6Q8_BRACR|nr:hypothetical protein F2Q69_00015709 [Brassica cretica]